MSACTGEVYYYESIDKIYAQVIVDVQDVQFYAIEEKDVDKKIRCEHLREIVLRLLKAIMDLKNQNLLYQVYVPMEIFQTTGTVIRAMQDNCELISQTAYNVFEEKECEEKKINEFVEVVLATIALLNTLIRKRLEKLTE